MELPFLIDSAEISRLSMEINFDPSASTQCPN